MILPDAESKELKDVQNVALVVNRAVCLEDPPPAYESPPVHVASTPSGFAVPDTVKPTNFLSLSRSNGGIKGTYVIDPCIKIPSSLLTPLAADETEETRRNMSLQAKNGHIEADIYVVGDAEAKRQCTLYLKSSNGAIVAKLHATPTSARPPIALRARTSNGSITLYIPASFRGPLTIRMRHGSPRLAPLLASATTASSEVGGTWHYFVGDLSDYTSEEEWVGDMLDLETHNGQVEVKYLSSDNAGDDPASSKKGFWGRLFGS